MKNVFGTLLTILLLTGTAFGDPLVAGDAEAGKAKSITCSACHGADGNSVNPVWPSIAGQHPTYIVEQLMAFKGDAVNQIPPSRNEPLMLGQVMLLNEDDMKNLAVYYSEMPAAAKSVADPSQSIVASVSIAAVTAKPARRPAMPAMDRPARQSGRLCAIGEGSICRLFRRATQSLRQWCTPIGWSYARYARHCRQTERRRYRCGCVVHAGIAVRNT